MTRLRRRLIVLFVCATLAPLALTLWVAQSLLDRSLRYSSTLELDEVSRSLEHTARQYYQREREALRDEITAGRLPGERFPRAEIRLWPAELQDFWESAESERYLLSGNHGDRLCRLSRREGEVLRWCRSLGGVQLEAIGRQYTQARRLIEDAQTRDLRRGFFYAFLALAALPWLAALGVVIFAARRSTAEAEGAFHRLASELQQSRERLLFLTRLESWQALARKTAHEVKNSLTPIRLMMEELAARHPRPDTFEQKAAQVIVDEVNSLERRVRAFSDLASEPPVHLKPLDAAALLEERVGFLKNAHPDVTYQLRVERRSPPVMADEDLLKAVLTNLLENAAQAAGPSGRVLARAQGGSIEVHDSGPGLSEQAQQTLFEPAISFKKGGMGVGLSIARKSAVLCGGDIVLVKGELGGAGFRVVLSPCPQPAS